MNNDLMKLDDFRRLLQELDLRLLLLLKDRFRLSEEMGIIKRRNNISPLQEEEWQRKIDFLSSYLEDSDKITELLNIFYLIHKLSVEMQERVQ